MERAPSPWAARKNIRLGTSAHRPSAVSTARRLHPHRSALDRRLMFHVESDGNYRAHASTARGQSEREAYIAVPKHTKTIPQPYQNKPKTIPKPYQKQNHTKPYQNNTITITTSYQNHTKTYQNHTNTIPTPHQNHTKTIPKSYQNNSKTIAKPHQNHTNTLPKPYQNQTKP